MKFCVKMYIDNRKNFVEFQSHGGNVQGHRTRFLDTLPLRDRTVLLLAVA